MKKTKNYNYPDGEDYYQVSLSPGDNFFVSNNPEPKHLFVSSFTSPLFKRNERATIGFKINNNNTK